MGPVLLGKKQCQYTKVLANFIASQRGRASHQPGYLLGPELTSPECCCEDRWKGTEPQKEGSSSTLLYKESQGQLKIVMRIKRF